MAKRPAGYQCAACGAGAPRWAGRCEACGSWATIEEATPVAEDRRSGGSSDGGSFRGWSAGAAQRLDEVDLGVAAGWPTGVSEVDRVLGGGLVPGSVSLFGGEPGIGKSTLLLQVASSLAVSGHRVLYVSAEEAPAQVRRRAERLRTSLADVWLLAETNLAAVVGAVADIEPQVLVVDSIQTVADPGVGSVPGTPNQVRECALRLVQVAKEHNIAVVLVGHVTKDGSLAGPRTLEHLVDSVLTFEGERHQGLRLLRAAKHRFGSCHEVGVFEMTETGLVAVADPSGVFLADRQHDVPGSIVVPVVDGHRPLLVEVQALVGNQDTPSPARTAEGVDHGRLTMILAVLSRRVGLPVGRLDVYALAAGGARALEPAVDLGLAVAVASSLSDRPLPADLVVCGELGLAGEVRQVSQAERRLHEAARVGFRRALVPSSMVSTTAPIDVLPVRGVADALAITIGRPC